MRSSYFNQLSLAGLIFFLLLSPRSQAEQSTTTYQIKYAFTVTRCDFDESTNKLTCVLFLNEDGAKIEQIPLQCKKLTEAKSFCTGNFIASATVENYMFFDHLFVATSEYGTSIENYLPDEPFEKGHPTSVIDIQKTSVTHIDPMMKSTLSDLIFFEGRSFQIKRTDGSFVHYMPALALFPVNRKVHMAEFKRRIEGLAMQQIRFKLNNEELKKIIDKQSGLKF